MLRDQSDGRGIFLSITGIGRIFCIKTSRDFISRAVTVVFELIAVPENVKLMPVLFSAVNAAEGALWSGV